MIFDLWSLCSCRMSSSSTSGECWVTFVGRKSSLSDCIPPRLRPSSVWPLMIKDWLNSLFIHYMRDCNDSTWINKMWCDVRDVELRKYETLFRHISSEESSKKISPTVEEMRVRILLQQKATETQSIRWQLGTFLFFCPRQLNVEGGGVGNENNRNGKNWAKIR